RGHGAQLDDVAQDADPEDLREERTCDRAESDSSGGFPGTGPLEDRSGFVEAVLLHAYEVGVPGPGAGQRRVAGEAGEHLGVDGISRHHLLPLRPLAVGDPQGYRSTERGAVPDAADEL